MHSPMRYAWDLEHTYFPSKKGKFSLVWFLRKLVLSQLRVWDVASSARVDLFFGNSRYVARRIELYYNKKCVVLAPPVHVSRFLDYVPKPNLENIPQPKKVLLFGAWVAYKQMFEALQILLDAGINVVAAGNGDTWPQAIKAFKHNKLVEFVESPSEEQVSELYATCHVLAFPGLEDFGIVPVEAMASGLPVVALARGGTLDTVLPGKTGFLFAPHAGGLAATHFLDCIKKALEKNYSEKEKLEIKAWAKNFDALLFQKKFCEQVKTEFLNLKNRSGG
jgi:glycosyltransferase involved in cell wall biosynthesis